MRAFLERARETLADKRWWNYQLSGLETIVQTIIFAASAAITTTQPMVDAAQLAALETNQEAATSAAEQPQYLQELRARFPIQTPAAEYLQQRAARLRERLQCQAAEPFVKPKETTTYQPFTLDKIVAVTQRYYFMTSKHNWVGINEDGSFAGQIESEYVPIDMKKPDGSIGWTGLPDSWEQQLRFMTIGGTYDDGSPAGISVVGASFNAYLDIIANGHRQHSINNFIAITSLEEHLRKEGYELKGPIIRVAPYLAPESWPSDPAVDGGDSYGYTRNFQLASEQDKIYNLIDQWLTDVFDNMGREEGLRHLAIYSHSPADEPKLIVGLYFINGSSSAPADFLQTISDRIKAKWGFGIHSTRYSSWRSPLLAAT